MIKIINDFSKPVLFVLIFMTLIVWFNEFFSGLGIITGLILSFVIFYYFGKHQEGILYVFSLFLVALSIDLILPPYMVDLNGAISNQALFSTASIDYFLGSIGQALGLTGIFLFYFTYVFSFAVLFGIATLLLKQSQRGE